MPARRAPAAPEKQHYDLALLICQFERAASEPLPGEVGRLVTLLEDGGLTLDLLKLLCLLVCGSVFVLRPCG